MSTIDPAVERARRQENQKGSLLDLLQLVVAAVVCLVAGYLFGRGLAGVVAVFLWMDAQGINEMSMSESPPYMWGLFVGIFVAIGGYFWYRWASQRFTGGPGLPVNGLSLAVAGAAYGFWVQGVWWVAPDDIWSERGRLTASEQPNYGATEWADRWLPIILVVVAVGFLAVSVWLFVRNLKGATTEGQPVKGRPAQQLLSTGRRTRGVVTEVAPTGVEINGRQLVRFTVKFTDQAGVQRWVTKKATFAPAATPTTGMSATVFYDPDRMDEKKIVVALEPLEVVEQRLSDDSHSTGRKADPAPSWGSVDDGFYRGDTTDDRYYRGDVQDR